METNMPTSWSLKGKVAVVTGAARGIGRATVLLLVERGASIVATDLNEAVHDLAGDGIATLTGDVSAEDTAKRTVALAIERFGGLDILINNAGRTLNKPLLDTSIDDWNAIMAVNARGDFLHAREAVRAMLNRGGGTIVNVASVVAAIAMKDMAAYASSKGAIAQLTKVIAVEHGRDGIRANAVGVGVVETDILEGIVDDSRATLASYGDAHPIGRVAQPREIAEVIAFLAAPASSFITGTLVMADGGYTAL
jgi:NAD(P)-dependent dehydrogenase (short-subunit alcohol dehydrogenase family)